MVPSVFSPVLVVWYLLDFTPVLVVWYLLLLHLFWQYGTFCFTPVLALWSHNARTGVKQKVPYCQNRCKSRRYHTTRTGVKSSRYHTTRTGEKKEGTIMPEQE
jgi:hypothetical protein